MQLRDRCVILGALALLLPCLAPFQPRVPSPTTARSKQTASSRARSTSKGVFKVSAAHRREDRRRRLDVMPPFMGSRWVAFQVGQRPRDGVMTCPVPDEVNR
jgi:hypothetical protein